MAREVVQSASGIMYIVLIFRFEHRLYSSVFAVRRTSVNVYVHIGRSPGFSALVATKYDIA